MAWDMVKNYDGIKLWGTLWLDTRELASCLDGPVKILLMI